MTQTERLELEIEYLRDRVARIEAEYARALAMIAYLGDDRDACEAAYYALYRETMPVGYALVDEVTHE